ncbi:MAG: glycosyltransferase family 2 protein [Actinomycetota bacterium]|nr:glycosyltransferase family 2 protein [Actinomycetota bacterium]
MEPLVSLVICTCNRCEDLERLLGSLQELTYPRVEIIVVDNNSTDNTRAVSERFNVRYVREDNQGISFARNRGIRESGGEYIAFLDDDVIVCNPDWVEKMLHVFSSDSKAGVVGGKIIARCIGTGSKLLVDALLARNGQDLGEENRILSSGFWVLGCSIMFARAAIKDISFNTELGRRGKLLLGREELEFIDKIARKGYKTGYCAGAVVYHNLKASRFTFRYIARHSFYEGISVYLHNGSKFSEKAVLAILANAASTVFYLSAADYKAAVIRFTNLCRAAGVFWGPFFKTLNAGF